MVLVLLWAEFEGANSVCLLHRYDGGFLLAHAHGTSATAHLSAGRGRALSASSPVRQPLRTLPAHHQLTGHLEGWMSTDAIR